MGSGQQRGACKGAGGVQLLLQGIRTGHQVPVYEHVLHIGRKIYKETILKEKYNV